jgi:hypothetical protein
MEKETGADENKNQEMEKETGVDEIKNQEKNLHIHRVWAPKPAETKRLEY